MMISFMRFVLGRIMSAFGHPLPATPEDLTIALHEKCTTGYNHWDQIIPGLFLGDAEMAKDILHLKEGDITHILNTAYVPSGKAGAAPTVGGNEEFYQKRGLKIHFKGITAMDIPSFQIHPFFEEAAEFIDNALSSGGRVFVHCFVGVSRSAALVIAYLMLKRGHTAAEATRLVRRKRHIYPNSGFLKQICDLDARLYKERKKQQRLERSLIQK